MKTKYLYIVTLLLLVTGVSPLTLSAKTEAKTNYRLTKLLYDNSSGEKGVTYFDYNEKGLSEIALWELENGNRYSLNFQYYDKNNNLIKKIREYSDFKNTAQLFTYDERNRLISEEFILRDTTRGITTFEYNAEDRLVRINCNAYNGWLNGVINLFYDQSGKKIKGEFIQKNKTAAKITYEYDEQDNLHKETWEFGVGWKQTFIYEYENPVKEIQVEFTSPNPYVINLKSPVLQEDYSYGDKISGPSYYFYSIPGKLVKKTYERSDGFSTNTYYFYSNDGTLIRAFRKYSNGKNALFRYKYNESRKMTEKEFFSSDKNHGSEKYFYNSGGVISNADFENSDMWLSGELKYTVDQHGLPLKAYYKDNKEFTADILFEYDNKDLLKKIVWNFSDGSRQVYSYFY